MFSHFSGMTRNNWKLGTILIFTPDSGHAYSYVPWAVCKTLSVKGFKWLEISPLLFRHNRGTGVTLTCFAEAVQKGLGVRNPDRLKVTPCGGWIEQSTKVCLSHWHLLLGTHCWGSIVMALFLKAWIGKWGFASAIHTCPSKLSDRGLYHPAFP